MTTTNFRIEVVAALFMAERQNTQPAQQDIIDFDADLMATYDSDLRQILTAENVPVNKANRSMALLISRSSPGNNPRQQIRQACRLLKTMAALNTQFFG
jgi:hypothetical protein